MTLRPVLDRGHVDSFLQNLNSQQPTIRFTVEIEKDNTIPFLDTSVTRDSDSLLISTVYRKPAHTLTSTSAMIHTNLSRWCVVLLSVYTT